MVAPKTSPPPTRTKPLALNPLTQERSNLQEKLRILPLPLNLIRDNRKRKLSGELLVRVERILALSKRLKLVYLGQGVECYLPKAVR